MWPSPGRSEVRQPLRPGTEGKSQETVVELAHRYIAQKLSATDKLDAEARFRCWLHDAGLSIRCQLADILKDAEELPHDIVMDLAGDVDAVSAPVLEHCKVLSEEDLIDVLRVSPATKQSAIARRRPLSRRLAAALAESESGEVIDTLLSNVTAEITLAIYQRLLMRFADEPHVLDTLEARRSTAVHG